MRRLKRRSKVTLSILLLCIILFFFWVNMNPCGDWIIKADEVEAEWFDYTWRSHSYVLSDEQKTEINEKIKLACANGEWQLFLWPIGLAGEASYHLNCSGKNTVQYTIRSAGRIIVENKRFPYQHGIFNISNEDTEEILDYIRNSEAE